MRNCRRLNGNESKQVEEGGEEVDEIIDDADAVRKFKGSILT